MLSPCVHDLECEEYMVCSVKVDKQIFKLEITNALTVFNVTAIHEIKGKNSNKFLSTIKSPSSLMYLGDIMTFTHFRVLKIAVTKPHTKIKACGNS